MNTSQPISTPPCPARCALTTAKEGFLQEIGPIGYEDGIKIPLADFEHRQLFPLDLLDQETLVTREGDFLQMPHPTSGGNLNLAEIAERWGLDYSLRDPVTLAVISP